MSISRLLSSGRRMNGDYIAQIKKDQQRVTNAVSHKAAHNAEIVDSMMLTAEQATEALVQKYLAVMARCIREAVDTCRTRVLVPARYSNEAFFRSHVMARLRKLGYDFESEKGNVYLVYALDGEKEIASSHLHACMNPSSIDLNNEEQ